VIGEVRTDVLDNASFSLVIDKRDEVSVAFGGPVLGRTRPT
jgi:hypothetical protein